MGTEIQQPDNNQKKTDSLKEELEKAFKEADRPDPQEAKPEGAPTDGSVPAWQTYGFWLSLVAIITGAVFASGLPQNDPVMQIAGVVAMVLGILGYTIPKFTTQKSPLFDPEEKPEEKEAPKSPENLPKQNSEDH